MADPDRDRAVNLVGTEHVLLEQRDGLVARGTAQAVDPLPYTCRYEVHTTAALPDGSQVEGTAWFEVTDDARHIAWGAEGESQYHGYLDVRAELSDGGSHGLPVDAVLFLER